MAESLYRKELDEEEERLNIKLAALTYMANRSEMLLNEALEAKNDPELEPSSRARLRYQRAVKRHLCKERWKHRGKTFQIAYQKVGVCVASLLFVGMGAFAVCYFTVDAVRERVDDILTYSTTEYTSVLLSDGETIVPRDWAGLFYPGYVPEGYYVHQQLRMYESGSGSLNYEKQEDPGEILHYATGPYQIKMKLETGGSIGDPYQINDMTAMLYRNNTQKVLFMTDGTVYHKITAGLSLPDEEIVQMAQSVQKAD